MDLACRRRSDDPRPPAHPARRRPARCRCCPRGRSPAAGPWPAGASPPRRWRWPSPPRPPTPGPGWPWSTCRGSASRPRPSSACRSSGWCASTRPTAVDVPRRGPTSSPPCSTGSSSSSPACRGGSTPGCCAGCSRGCRPARPCCSPSAIPARCRRHAMEASPPVWEGVEHGAGHLRGRRVTVVASGRRIPRPRRAELWLPGPGGIVVAVDGAVGAGSLVRCRGRVTALRLRASIGSLTLASPAGATGGWSRCGAPTGRSSPPGCRRRAGDRAARQPGRRPVAGGRGRGRDDRPAPPPGPAVLPGRRAARPRSRP